MAYRWHSEDSAWLEHAPGTGSSRFELERSRELSPVAWAHARGRLADVAAVLGAALPASCDHAAIFPENFAFCPDCGAPLLQAGDAPRLIPAWAAPPGTAALPASAWPLPKHAPQGLPLTSAPLAQALEKRAPEPAVGQAELRLPVPPNAVSAFISGTFGFAAQRLLALAYTRNVLQYWDPCASHWQLLAPEEGAAQLRFERSAFAWLPASGGRRGEVGLLPGDGGLYRLLVNPVNESFRTEAVLHAPLASSPGAAGRYIACLVAAPEGPRLWTALADGADPESLPVNGSEVPDSGWSRPYSYDGALVWLHERGHLLWHPGRAPQWLAWPFPWKPRLQFGGPARSRDGRLWLIGHDGESYSFRELGRAGGQVQPIDGARLGFNTLLFRRGHQVKNDPWSVEDVEDQRHGDALVLPLLENISATRSQPSGLVLRIEGYTGKAEAALSGELLPRTLFEWVGQRNVILDEIVRLRHPADCLPFVHNDCLWLHHPSWNHIRGWRLGEEP
ncbi:hypothetical protein [Massilia endophytica]|uniref:hypothetical protein n=1 Tax=Massilia endophytica TaxID=2899220 RepID=UPI001E29404A|nr:hypothetical protein [Massilia endophytica]UGQ45398.1 hypothetical protein LSQ66_16595 [Massilia endophytica]